MKKYEISCELPKVGIEVFMRNLKDDSGLKEVLTRSLNNNGDFFATFGSFINSNFGTSLDRQESKELSYGSCYFISKKTILSLIKDEEIASTYMKWFVKQIKSATNYKNERTKINLLKKELWVTAPAYFNNKGVTTKITLDFYDITLEVHVCDVNQIRRLDKIKRQLEGLYNDAFETVGLKPLPLYVSIKEL